MRPMRRFPLTLLAAAQIAFASSASLVAGGADAQSPTLNRIKATGTITFGYRDNAVPFSYQDRDGRVKGYSVELCTRVAGSIQKDLGMSELKIEWLPVEASNRLDYVISGKVDAVCGTTTMTLGRMQKVEFSLPIYVDGGSVLVRARSKLTKLTDLSGKKVAVIAGTTTEEELGRGLDSRGTKATLVQVKTAAEGMALLDKGSVDAYAADRVVLAYLKLRSPSPDAYAFVTGDFSYEPFGLPMRRDDPDFKLAVNRALAAIYRSGDIDPIFQRWLGALGVPGPLLHAMFYLSAIPE
jgi:polar amino acid transport system substrate-binding protein/glutamate/aspartate transport system substrate-binding protein